MGGDSENGALFLGVSSVQGINGWYPYFEKYTQRPRERPAEALRLVKPELGNVLSRMGGLRVGVRV